MSASEPCAEVQREHGDQRRERVPLEGVAAVPVHSGIRSRPGTTQAIAVSFVCCTTKRATLRPVARSYASKSRFCQMPPSGPPRSPISSVRGTCGTATPSTRSGAFAIGAAGSRCDPPCCAPPTAIHENPWHAFADGHRRHHLESRNAVHEPVVDVDRRFNHESSAHLHALRQVSATPEASSRPRSARGAGECLVPLRLPRRLLVSRRVCNCRATS